MTEQGNEQGSAFNQRSDSAAAQLKQAMGLPESQVTVDAQGNPPAPPPPEGSYARSGYDEAQAAATRISQAEQAQQVQPPVPDQPTPREQFTPEISDKAAERIQDLVNKLREKDQAFQLLQASQSNADSKITELTQAAEQLRAQHEAVLAQRLEELSPEDRAAVIGNQQIAQAVQDAETRLLQRLQPRLDRLDEQTVARDYEGLAGKYPGGFNPRVHPDLIKQFRDRNPNCSVELAFRAVATDEELGVGRASPANPIPPSLAPSHTGIPKSVPTQRVSHPQSTPDQEIREEAAQAFNLLRSKDSADQKAGMRALDANLHNRLFGDPS
ncbi:MAG: hypothetical protein V3S98_06270 [Dehalococcoidia bacterium]